MLSAYHSKLFLVLHGKGSLGSMGINWVASEADFDRVRKWGHLEDPFAAVKDFSFTKLERRWLNPEQESAYARYVDARNSYIQDANFDQYYRKAEKPIDKKRWDYLRLRKSWFQMPLGWDRIAQTGGKVYDLGCGDGDTVQQLIEFCQKFWNQHPSNDATVEIIGLDLNPSRIENARNLVHSSSERISVEFEVSDLTQSNINAGVDYAMICGVLEILEPETLDAFIKQVCGCVSRGIYIEDLFEQFPGGYPNDKIGRSFVKYGFQTMMREVVMTEPFSETELQDPIRLWPCHIDQNLWLEPI